MAISAWRVEHKGAVLQRCGLFNFLVFFCFLLVLAAPVQASLPLVAVGVLEDHTATLGINEVVQQDFEPSSATLARGYSQSAFWVKLTIAPSNEQRLLRIRPPYLDHVTFYRSDPLQPGGWVVLQNGDRVALNDRTIWGTSLSFPLPVSTQDETIFLRLKTESSSLMNIEVMTLPAFQRSEFRTMLWQLLLMSAMLGLLIWAALDYAVSKQTIVGVFLLVQVAQIGYVFALGGYLPILSPSDVGADLVASFIVVIAVIVTLLFHRILIDEFEPNRWALWVLNLLIVACLVALVLLLLGDTQNGMRITSMSVVLLIPLLLWLAITATRNRLPGLVTLRVTYFALAGVLFFVMAPIFGVWVSFDLYLWATTTQGLITGLIMAAFLFRRSIHLRRQSLLDQLELARYQEKLVVEQRTAADQRQFLDMLAHELKTPLGVIQLTLDSVDLSAQQQKRLQRSLETMSAVIDRCRLSLQLDEGRLQPKFEQVDIVNEVENLVLACKEPDRIGLEVDDPHALQTDRELFVVILQNLLDNALKYSTPDSLVTVSVQACDRDGRAGVIVCVHNAVLRPPVQRAEQLFEKYFRGSNAGGLTGSGLGLHLSKQLAQIIYGQLWVELGPNDIRFCLWTPN